MYSRNKKTRAAPVGAIKAPASGESTLLKESAEQIAHFEVITGKDRAKWDEELHARAAEVNERKVPALVNQGHLKTLTVNIGGTGRGAL